MDRDQHAHPEPHEAARELERADQQAILDSLPAMIAYWDRDLRNRLANKVYVEYFGMNPEEIFGHHISEVLGPELYEKNLPYLRAALAGERQEFDREIPTPTGPRYTQATYLPDIHDGEVRGIFVLVTDISARRRAEVALAHAETRFRILFEAAPSATLMTDLNGTVVSANRAAGQLFGYDVADLVGMGMPELLYPEDRAGSSEIRQRLVSGELAHFSEERRYRHALGHTIWAQADVTVVYGAAGPDDDSPYFLAQLQDTSERKSHERELERLASQDPLTGVLNRRGLTRELEREAALASAGGLTVVLVCDLDRFKQVNDELGHAVGDELLVQIARALEQSVRATDLVGRLGGDEFAVILHGADLEQAAGIGEAISRRVAVVAASGPWCGLDVSLSIGAAMFTPGCTGGEVLREADRAMYAAKYGRGADRRA